MTVHTTLTGPFPRSEALVAATRDLDRGRTSPAEVSALYRETEGAIAALEGRLGLDPPAGGYLEWADLFRPFAEAWPGFTVGPVTRWFETNTFYRQPILRAPPERRAGAIAPRLPRAGEVPPAGRKVTLPGPYTFAGLLDNRSGETREALTHRFGRLLAEEVGELAGLGYGAFQFQEPLLVVEPPKGPLAEATIAAYRSIAAAAGSRPTIVWTFFAPPNGGTEVLPRLPVGAVGFDLSETDPGEIPTSFRGKSLGLGILDPRTTLAEDPGEIARIVREVEGRLAPPTVWLGAGAPLDLLPYEAAVRKLELLPNARRLLSPGGSGR